MKKRTKLEAKFRGVSWDSDREKWRVVVNGKSSYFDTKTKAIVESAKAKDEAERLKDPDGYFWKDRGKGSPDWDEASIRDISMTESIDLMNPDGIGD